MNIKELSKELGVSEQALRSWCKRNGVRKESESEAKGKKAGYYIDQAGGWGNRAKKSHTFIIYMNGKVARVAHNAKPEPGCEIFVPSKAERDPRMLAQTLSIASSVASFASIIATLANIIK